jgi:1,4-dihydroxy-2-naphthoate octaprenyltransferase
VNAERKINLLTFLLAVTTTVLLAISSASSASLFDYSRSTDEELFRVLVAVAGAFKEMG